MSFLFDIVVNAFLRMLELIWFGKRNISNSLSIYVKTNTGNTLSVDLDPKWDIKNVKEIVAPKMGISPEDIKIIFAGKELHNSTIISVCSINWFMNKQNNLGDCLRLLIVRRNAIWVNRVSFMRSEHRRREIAGTIIRRILLKNQNLK